MDGVGRLDADGAGSAVAEGPPPVVPGPPVLGAWLPPPEPPPVRPDPAVGPPPAPPADPDCGGTGTTLPGTAGAGDTPGPGSLGWAGSLPGGTGAAPEAPTVAPLLAADPPAPCPVRPGRPA
ncbi:hypothetical protein E6W39_19825 [Kitasatospora acidiphila]|uniref:Uncharacterized protein n=1 Tax=Kitasatospora acidiphila TaxID=2567942 RepID=A0A540W4Y4_9ACTN|nr:hypothetical protein [Kitasatospora acidiphila]TQF04066.1 hypothetical protein E6W39_19825 [Kitasatospora acidiphila]